MALALLGREVRAREPRVASPASEPPSHTPELPGSLPAGIHQPSPLAFPAPGHPGPASVEQASWPPSRARWVPVASTGLGAFTTVATWEGMGPGACQRRPALCTRWSRCDGRACHASRPRHRGTLGGLGAVLLAPSPGSPRSSGSAAPPAERAWRPPVQAITPTWSAETVGAARLADRPGRDSPRKGRVMRQCSQQEGRGGPNATTSAPMRSSVVAARENRSNGCSTRNRTFPGRAQLPRPSPPDREPTPRDHGQHLEWRKVKRRAQQPGDRAPPP